MQAIRVFVEPLAFDLPAGVPAPTRCGERALALADSQRSCLSAEAAVEEKELYADVLRMSARNKHCSIAMQVEQVQEKEQQQDQEQEQEQETSQEEELVGLFEPARHNFSRADDAARPWDLSILHEVYSASAGGMFGTGGPFYP